MRRFLPVVIPGLLLLAAWTAERLLELPLPRRVGPVLATAVVAGCIAVPLAELAPLRTERQQAGAVALMRRVCDSLPPHAAVLVVKSPNYNDVVQPVHAFCRVPVATIYRPIPRRRFEAIAPGLRRSGHELVLLATTRGALKDLVGPRAPRRPLARIDYRVLEQRLTSRPRRQVREEYRVYMARG